MTDPHARSIAEAIRALRCFGYVPHGVDRSGERPVIVVSHRQQVRRLAIPAEPIDRAGLQDAAHALFAR